MFFFSCKKEKGDKKTESLKSKTITPKIVTETSNTKFSTNDYTLVYQYSDGESNQILGINLIDKKMLKFHLVTETLPCDTEYWGKAENKNWNGDGEIDEDEDGGYFVDEYFKEEKEYFIGIRLDEDLNKVQIKYIQKDSLETDCLPITGKIMKRIK
ncbi:hypothetical protein [Flavobacterium sp.]|uniref:hypothetical protein n=1 Tax=Flavobacterium sp. TaxID=239 RepID=UPI0026034F92|nr:hypothetical protein [Flavobacterium sp.]